MFKCFADYPFLSCLPDLSRIVDTVHFDTQ